MGNCHQQSNSNSRENNQKNNQGKYEVDGSSGAQQSVIANILPTRLHSSGILNVVSLENQIATCSDDHSIAISDISSLFHHSDYKPLIINGHEKAVSKVHFMSHKNFESKRLCSASRDLSIKLWDIKTDESPSLLCHWKDAHSLNITAISDIPQESNLIVSGSRDYSVKLWDIETQQCQREYKISRNIVTSICTSRHLPQVVVQSSEDLSVKFWDIREPKHLPSCSISGFIYFTLNMDIDSHQGYSLVTGCKGFNSVGCNVFVWDLRKLPSLQQEYRNNYIYSQLPVHDFQGHSQDVTGCLFSKKDPNCLYSCSKDGSVYAWHLEDPAVSETYKFPKKYLTSMCLLDTEIMMEAQSLSKGSSSQLEYLALSGMDGSLVILSYSFDLRRFTLLNMTTPAFDSDEIEY